MYTKYTKVITIIGIIAICVIIAKYSMAIISAVDVNRSYKYAVIYTPNGEVLHEGEIIRYVTHTVVVEVKFKDDGWYCASINNCVLYGERDLDQEMGMHDT